VTRVTVNECAQCRADNARPAAIGLRIRFTCRVSRRNYPSGPNGRLRRISCHCCISYDRARVGLLRLASSLMFTCPTTSGSLAMLAAIRRARIA
jgi:hypothetical protein